MTPADRRDTSLRSRLAATGLREPAPEMVQRWQAALRDLPPPTHHSPCAGGPGWPDWWLAVPDEPTVEIGDSGGPAAVTERSTGVEEPTDIATDRDRPATEPTDIATDRPAETALLAESGGPIKHYASSRRLSSDSKDPFVGTPTPADIRIVAAATRPAVAGGPLTTVNAVAVAKIRLVRPRSGLAAAICGLAAAITAIAVIGPTAASQVPATATGRQAGTGPAGTAAAGWPRHPAATDPTDHPTAALPGDSPAAPRPSDVPATQPSGQPVDPEPLAVTRGQLLATTPTGRDLGTLADPAELSACLARFGSTGQPVAARRVVLDGRAGVALVLPTELPGRLRLLVVDPGCGSAIVDDLVGR